MNTNRSLRSGNDARSYASDAMQTGENAMDQTRQIAAQALEKAGEKMRDMSVGARELANRSMHTVSDKAAIAQERLGRYADVTTRYVSDEPIKAALIAATVGAAVAAILIAARRRSRRQF
ncbi:MAG TPA: hypothetical protein VEY69_13680 [Lautropia sp.]|jgi:ElaB/YqjD/DUF883 family membrane-anchored ribosome-binding protein|nr:hypothetical protein [Lautropia sp.]